MFKYAHTQTVDTEICSTRSCRMCIFYPSYTPSINVFIWKVSQNYQKTKTKQQAIYEYISEPF